MSHQHMFLFSNVRYVRCETTGRCIDFARCRHTHIDHRLLIVSLRACECVHSTIHPAPGSKRILWCRNVLSILVSRRQYRLRQKMTSNEIDFKCFRQSGKKGKSNNSISVNDSIRLCSILMSLSTSTLPNSNYVPPICARLSPVSCMAPIVLQENTETGPNVGQMWHACAIHFGDVTGEFNWADKRMCATRHNTTLSN